MSTDVVKVTPGLPRSSIWGVVFQPSVAERVYTATPAFALPTIRKSSVIANEYPNLLMLREISSSLLVRGIQPCDKSRVNTNTFF
jgi:hypothetical protein